jgi:hypothetical protein
MGASAQPTTPPRPGRPSCEVLPLWVAAGRRPAVSLSGPPISVPQRKSPRWQSPSPSMSPGGTEQQCQQRPPCGQPLVPAGPSEPAHPVVAAGMRGVEGIEPAVYITDPATGGCSDLFNAVYELVLQMIARYFAFGHETPGQRQVLAHAAVGLMFQAIKPLGLLLARLPVGPAHPGATAGANFQLPYRASFLPRGVAPLRRAPRRVGRLRRRPPSARGRRRGGSGVSGTGADGLGPDSSRRSGVTAVSLGWPEPAKAETASAPRRWQRRISPRSPLGRWSREHAVRTAAMAASGTPPRR